MARLRPCTFQPEPGETLWDIANRLNCELIQTRRLSIILVALFWIRENLLLWGVI
jgi:hypothetical protein